jgi:Fe-S cluster assembly protein SufB
MAKEKRNPFGAESYLKKYGFSTRAEYGEFEKGLSEAVVRKISELKGEPEWMLEKRLLAYKVFEGKPMPKWGPDLGGIRFDELCYYKMPRAKGTDDWEKVPAEIKRTFEKLGVPEAERRFFAGVEAQFDSGMVYSGAKKMLDDLGVIFMDTDTAVKEHPDLMRKYFGTVIPATDNKFAALNTAVWSGGSFVYIPKGVKVSMPLNAYFRINAEHFGQFERTLIIADEGSEVTYLEGCTAPVYSTDSLHSGVVEVVALKGAHVRYATVQNWSKNIYNLVTQRAHAYDDAHVEWIDANIGSKANMKYPSVVLKGRRSKGEILSIALAGEGQEQDSGGKVYHLAPDTTSRVVSKSVSKGSGLSTFRGIVQVGKDASNVRSSMSCNSLLLDGGARANTYPCVDVARDDALVSHEARVGRISDDDLFYLMSRGIPEADATAMIIMGFISDLAKALPMEYSLELKRLIKLDFESGVG